MARRRVGIRPASHGLGDVADLDPIISALESRAYSAAQRGRMNSDWSVSHLDANEEIRSGLLTVRAASRNLERNNDLYRKWLGLLVANIVHEGFELESTPRNARGGIDQTAAQQIEGGWREWTRGKVSLDGQRTFVEECRLWARTIPRDGEVLVLPAVREREFRLQTLEADYLPLELHSPRDRTLLGITFDEDRRPVAYWIANQHPGSTFGGGWSRAATRRTPASEVLHAFIAERPGQVRGVPWGTAAFDNLLLLQGYKIAELAAARIGAARPVSIETEVGEEAKFTGDGVDPATNAPQVNGEPGGVTLLKPGQRMVWGGAEHPSGNYADFTTEVKRDIAAALGVSYHALNSDLSSANYSSLRHGRADEIRQYLGWQQFIASALLTPIFERWLEWFLLSGKSRLPLDRIEKFREHRWHPPRFEALDPYKEAQGIELELALGLTTHSDEAAKRGREWEELVAKRAADEEILRRYGVKLGKTIATPQTGTPPEPDDDDDDQGDEE